MPLPECCGVQQTPSVAKADRQAVAAARGPVCYPALLPAVSTAILPELLLKHIGNVRLAI
jgi:hypothetical protein